MNNNCLVIGDLNIDLVFAQLKDYPEMGKEIVTKHHFMDIGGSGGIFSAVLSKLGIKTYIISKIGNDLFGNFLIDKLENYGVNTSRLVKDREKETGITVSLSYSKDKYQISSLELVRNLSIDEVMFENIKNISHIHFTSYYMMSSLKKYYPRFISDIKKSYPNVTFSLDTNDDPENRWDIDGIYEVLKNINVFLANEREALNITNESNVEDALNELGKKVEIVVIKLGERGYIAKHGKEIYSEKPPSVRFVDSTGAGDNFDAGFIYGLMNGFDIRKSLKIANICGSKSVEHLGGVGNEERFFKIKNLIERVNLDS